MPVFNLGRHLLFDWAQVEQWVRNSPRPVRLLPAVVGESTQRGGLATFIGGSIPPRASNIFGDSYNREKDNAQT